MGGPSAKSYRAEYVFEQLCVTCSSEFSELGVGPWRMTNFRAMARTVPLDLRLPLIEKYAFVAWLVALTVLMALAVNQPSRSFEIAQLADVFLRAIVPLSVCYLISATIVRVQVTRFSYGFVLPYLLFFSISLTSLFGLTETLTGSHAESDNLFLYGLSFYTATLAYFAVNRTITHASPLVASNPLLLITGPIATIFRSEAHRSVGKRVQYYAPFIVIGVFFHQAVATPLTNTFHLISETDLVSALVFAAIFELFVYANFCGLSLAIYGLMGVFGVRVPLNFRQPFSARNLIEFWRGWHTSLSTVLKTLFYTPTRKVFGTTAAIFVVYFGSAMWHGVTFNFVLWGLFHGACFVATLMVLRRKILIVPTIIMIFAVVVGRLIFADADTGRLLAKLTFQFQDFSALTELMAMGKTEKLALLMISGLVAAEFLFRDHRLFRQRTYKFLRLPIVQLCLLFVTLFLVSHQTGVDYAVYGQR